MGFSNSTWGRALSARGVVIDDEFVLILGDDCVAYYKRRWAQEAESQLHPTADAWELRALLSVMDENLRLLRAWVFRREVRLFKKVGVDPENWYQDQLRKWMLERGEGGAAFVPKGERPEAGAIRLRLGSEVHFAAAYLDTDDREILSGVLEAVRVVADVLGYDEIFDADLVRGSFKWRAKIRTWLSSDELQERLVKLERAAEVKFLDSRQADIDDKESHAVSQLVTSLENVPQACIRIGSILFVKYESNGSPTLLVRQLSQLEIRALERYPEIQAKPALALEQLALTVGAMDMPATPEMPATPQQ